jgi:predicted porin
MNKKVMAIAVAGVFAVPAVALAQKSTVEIYGRANLGLDHYQAKGATAGTAAETDGRIRIFDNSSRVGFRGTEALGSGLSAIFQFETGVNVDTGNNLAQSGSANASSGFWASRDSFVGLDSNFGRLTFGRQSIYWANGVNAQFAANYINTEIPWTNGTNLGKISLQGAAVARVSNTVQYTTPTFGGFNATLSYAPGAEAVQGGTNTDTDGRVLGVTLRGTFGAFYTQFDYADVANNSVLSTGVQATGKAYKLGGSWGYMPGARIGIIWVRTDVGNETGSVTGVTTGDDVKQDGFTINWEHTFGNIQPMAQYGWTGDMKGCDVVTTQCDNTKSTAFMIGARYFLSKRTWVYASYNQVTNKDNQFADFTGGGITSTAGSPATHLGADPKIWALGIFHSF